MTNVASTKVAPVANVLIWVFFGIAMLMTLSPVLFMSKLPEHLKGLGALVPFCGLALFAIPGYFLAAHIGKARKTERHLGCTRNHVPSL